VGRAPIIVGPLHFALKSVLRISDSLARVSIMNHLRYHSFLGAPILDLALALERDLSKAVENSSTARRKMWFPRDLGSLSRPIQTCVNDEYVSTTYIGAQTRNL